MQFVNVFCVENLSLNSLCCESLFCLERNKPASGKLRVGFGPQPGPDTGTRYGKVRIFLYLLTLWCPPDTKELFDLFSRNTCVIPHKFTFQFSILKKHTHNFDDTKKTTRHLPKITSDFIQ